MQIGVITGPPLDDIYFEVPDSEKPMEVDAKQLIGTDFAHQQANLPTSPLSQEAEKYQEVVIHADYPEQKVKIGRELSRKEAVELVAFLQANLSVFA